MCKYLNRRNRSAQSLKEIRKKTSKFIHLTKLSYGEDIKDKNISVYVAGIIRVKKSLNLCSEILPGG
jgi:hypothetical protein